MLSKLDALLPPLAPVGTRAWIVGGGVRDALLGRTVADVDLAIVVGAEDAAMRLAEAHRASRFVLSDEFGAWRVHGGSLPFTVDITPIQGADLAEDLSRRDLTVNALAYPVAGGELVDLHGGRSDLEARVLRMVGQTALRDDPVRLARVARLACQLGFRVDPETRVRARMDAGEITRGAPERVADELRRIARLPDAWRGFEHLDDLGVLGVIVPELEEGRGLEQTPYHHKDVLGHTLEVIEHVCAIRSQPGEVFRATADRIAAEFDLPLADELTRGEALVFAALFHDMAKPATYAVTTEGRATFFHHDRRGAEMANDWCLRYRTSTRFRETVRLCVRRHLALGFMVHRQPLSLRQIDRYLRSTAPAEVELMVLSVADRLATNGPRTTSMQITRHQAVARELAAWYFRLRDKGPIRPVLSGAQLADLLERPAGRWTAELLEALREEQLVGRVVTVDQARRFARAWSHAREESLS
jgi:tRNA nucleotidyltransferase/poly(A) polymerase